MYIYIYRCFITHKAWLFPKVSFAMDLVSSAKVSTRSPEPKALPFDFLRVLGRIVAHPVSRDTGSGGPKQRAW